MVLYLGGRLCLSLHETKIYVPCTDRQKERSPWFGSMGWWWFNANAYVNETALYGRKLICFVDQMWGLNGLNVCQPSTEKGIIIWLGLENCLTRAVSSPTSDPSKVVLPAWLLLPAPCWVTLSHVSQKAGAWTESPGSYVILELWTVNRLSIISLVL